MFIRDIENYIKQKIKYIMTLSMLKLISNSRPNLK